MSERLTGAQLDVLRVLADGKEHRCWKKPTHAGMVYDIAAHRCWNHGLVGWIKPSNYVISDYGRRRLAEHDRSLREIAQRTTIAPDANRGDAR